ncbi:dynamin family protein [Aerosakkonemataceae cyanobacterium BLCC-F50]|uniref:Dynamin family protein n=1 Tax=Floridaenema flaviceps BLCC-F50 TaxID=3153642 RepID=A0ABV4Y1I4_9CYAN
MDSGTLHFNIKDLKRNVTDLLGEISDLIYKVSQTLSFDELGSKKCLERMAQIDNEKSKVNKLELRMAIVAQMNAGKTTIINAIVGQQLLPSRITAMTTLPTEVVLKAELDQPIMKLNPDGFHQALVSLRNVIKDKTKQEINNLVPPELNTLLEEIKGDFTIPAQTTGCEEICQLLTKLNDIIRLLKFIEVSTDIIKSVNNVPRIETPFWQSEQINQLEIPGTLVIVDTPGSNESSVSEILRDVVARQLQQSSIVLLVLNLEELQSIAAEEVKKEVQKVNNLRGKDNLYVLVNKIDQRREGDLTPEQIQQFVIRNLGLSEVEVRDRVFEISARQALAAASFMRELDHLKNPLVPDIKTAQLLAEETLGTMWENKLKQSKVQDLKLEAEHLWHQKSGFPKFIQRVLKALIEESAPRCIKLALSISHNHLSNLYEEMKQRTISITNFLEVIREDIRTIEIELSNLEQCKNNIEGEIEYAKKLLYEEINEMINKYKAKARKNKFFDPTPIGKFENQKEVEEARKDLIDKLENQVEKNINKTSKKIKERFDELIQNFRKKLVQIGESYSSQLRGDISNIDLPQLNLGDSTVDLDEPPITAENISKSLPGEKIPMPKNPLQHLIDIIVPKPTILPATEETVKSYSFNVDPIGKQAKKIVLKRIEKMDKKIKNYLDKNIESKINIEQLFQESLGKLHQAKNEKDLLLSEQIQLKDKLSLLCLEAEELLKTVDTTFSGIFHKHPEPMSETPTNDFRGANFSNFGSITGNIQGDVNNIGTQHNYAPNQNLAESAAEIQQLLEQLAKNNQRIVQSDDQAVVVSAIHEEIKRNPTIKARLLSALKAGGTEALKVALDAIFKNPAVSISVETVKGFIEAE